MGQRLVELEISYTVNADGSGILHCSNLPPNPAIFPPGPAREWSSSCLLLGTPESFLAVLFIVVNGIPSVGSLVMVGSGKIDQQDVLPPAPLPAPFITEDYASPAAGGDRKKTNFARPMQAEISWPSMLTWTLGTGLWLLLF
jgi:hypothetical protein